jgi:tetrapyrrole methylase family protein/MazG family protein
MAITIIGLGPGDAGLLTRQAWRLLTAAAATAEPLYLRTIRHPAVAGLPAKLQLHSFDHIYESATDFASVYEQIAAEVLGRGRTADILYAVPGHPFVGEATVTAVIKAANEEGIAVDVVEGLSFVEPTLAALGVDALDGLQLFDAIAFAGFLYPPLNPDVPLLLGQVYSQMFASEVKLTLMSIYPDEHQVSLVNAAGGPNEVVESLPLYAIDRSEQIGPLTARYVPPLALKSSLPALAETVAILRSPHGCPWDQEQTPKSMRETLLEEAYEVLDAIDTADPDNLREELGDLLYHVVMQTQMASEIGDFNLTDVIARVEAKLKRRHPHVWGDWQVANSAEVLANWEKLKQREKAEQPASLLDNILLNLPALARSQKIQDRVARVGFEWPDVSGVYEKLEEELNEVRLADTPEAQQQELGDLLFVVVNLARWLRVDAESALREANNRFSHRFRMVEQLISERQLDWLALTFVELDALWKEVKEALAEESKVSNL